MENQKLTDALHCHDRKQEHNVITIITISIVTSIISSIILTFLNFVILASILVICIQIVLSILTPKP